MPRKACWLLEPGPVQEKAMIELRIDHQPQSIGSSEVGPQSMTLATGPAS
jgi:hypothetical protein